MTKKRDIHVVPHNDGWATRKEGAQRVGSTARRQAAADEFSLRAAIALFVAVLVMAAVSFQLLRIAMAITAGWTATLFTRTGQQQAANAEHGISPVPTSHPAMHNPRRKMCLCAFPCRAGW